MRLDDGCTLPVQKKPPNYSGPIFFVKQDGTYALKEAFVGLTAVPDRGPPVFDSNVDPAYTVFRRAFWLRYLIHFVGDIHQPLHTAQSCSAKHPQGDGGGNLFKVWITFFCINELKVEECSSVGFLPRSKIRSALPSRLLSPGDC